MTNKLATVYTTISAPSVLSSWSDFTRRNSGTRLTTPGTASRMMIRKKSTPRPGNSYRANTKPDMVPRTSIPAVVETATMTLFIQYVLIWPHAFV